MSEKKKGTATVLLQRSPARYKTPDPIVYTGIKADSPQFTPVPVANNSVYFGLKAKLDSPVTIPHRGTTVIDCGFSINLPNSKFRIAARANEKNAKRGLLVGLMESEEGRVRVVATNVGKEVIVIANEELVAEMYLEPAFLFGWIHAE